MKDINTTLLRERFSIVDAAGGKHEEQNPVIALSNRITVSLSRGRPGDKEENFVIRTQNVHSCVRMVARIVQEYDRSGSLLNRATAFDWAMAWDILNDGYEETYNAQRWVVIYHDGKVLYASGQHHSFFDVIEGFDAKQDDGYEQSFRLAEAAFQQAGKKVRIHYDGNVALVIKLQMQSGKCGVILRGSARKTTFNFQIAASEADTLNFGQCISACAAFLEGIQLCFLIGCLEEKLKRGILDRFAPEERQAREARKRLDRLEAEIASLENSYAIRYRPERPDFTHLIIDAAHMIK